MALKLINVIKNGEDSDLRADFTIVSKKIIKVTLLQALITTGISTDSLVDDDVMDGLEFLFSKLVKTKDFRVWFDSNRHNSPQNVGGLIRLLTLVTLHRKPSDTDYTPLISMRSRVTGKKSQNNGTSFS